MTREELLEWLRTEVSGFLEIDPATVQMDTNFFDDLEADSIDLVEVVTIIERELSIEIDDQHLYDVETVGELVDVILMIQAKQTSG